MTAVAPTARATHKVEAVHCDAGGALGPLDDMAARRLRAAILHKINR